MTAPDPVGVVAVPPNRVGTTTEPPAHTGLTAQRPGVSGVIASPPTVRGADVPNSWIRLVVPEVLAELAAHGQFEAVARARVSSVLEGYGVLNATAMAGRIYTELEGAAILTASARARVASVLAGASVLSSVARARVTGTLSVSSAMSANVRARVASSLNAQATFTSAARLPGVTYLENFPTDSTTGWGSDWLNQGGSPTPRIQSGVAVMGSLSNGSSGYCYSRYNPRPLTDNVQAAVRVVKPPNQAQAQNNELIITLRGTDNFQGAGHSGVWFVMFPGECYIQTLINGTVTSRVQGGAVAVNSEIRCIANGNVYTLYNFTTSTTLCTWTDSSNEYAYAGNRYMHMYQEGNYPIFQQAYGSYGADWIEYKDLV